MMFARAHSSPNVRWRTRFAPWARPQDRRTRCCTCSPSHESSISRSRSRHSSDSESRPPSSGISFQGGATPHSTSTRREASPWCCASSPPRTCSTPASAPWTDARSARSRRAPKRRRTRRWSIRSVRRFRPTADSPCCADRSHQTARSSSSPVTRDDTTAVRHASSTVRRPPSPPSAQTASRRATSW